MHIIIDCFLNKEAGVCTHTHTHLPDPTAAGYTLSRTSDPRAACGRATVPGREEGRTKKKKKKKLGEPEPVKKTQTKNKLAGGGFEPLSPDSVSGMLTTAPTRHYYYYSPERLSLRTHI